MSTCASVHRRAPAKVNLALAVGAANPSPPAGDGLHPISSWFAAIDLYDELTVTRLEHDRASRYAILWHDQAPRPSPIDWSVTKDLAVRAHAALESAVGRRLPVQMKLEKRIPVGAGLAGGSSDAAAMMRAVSDLYQLGLTEARLNVIARELGSDVAFFLTGDDAPSPRPALVAGVGDEIVRTPAVTDAAGDPVGLALILPDLACATPAVYRAFDAACGGPFDATRARALAERGVVISDELFNDLAEPACAVEPRLAKTRAALTDSIGAAVHVTGSGAGMFVVLGSDADATLALLRDGATAHECAALRVRVL